MSLEALLEANTAAVAKNNALLEKQNVLYEKTLELAQSRVAAASGTPQKAAEKAVEESAEPKRRGRPKKSEKVEAEADDGEVEDTSAIDDDADETPAPKKSAANEVTFDAFRKAVTGWLGEISIETDEDGEPLDNEANKKALRKRAARKSFVEKTYVKAGLDGKPNAETDSETFAQILAWIETRKTGVDPFAVDDDV